MLKLNIIEFWLETYCHRISCILLHVCKGTLQSADQFLNLKLANALPLSHGNTSRPDTNYNSTLTIVKWGQCEWSRPISSLAFSEELLYPRHFISFVLFQMSFVCTMTLWILHEMNFICCVEDPWYDMSICRRMRQIFPWLSVWIFHWVRWLCSFAKTDQDKEVLQLLQPDFARWTQNHCRIAVAEKRSRCSTQTGWKTQFKYVQMVVPALCRHFFEQQHIIFLVFALYSLLRSIDTQVKWWAFSAEWDAPQQSWSAKRTQILSNLSESRPCIVFFFASMLVTWQNLSQLVVSCWLDISGNVSAHTLTNWVLLSFECSIRLHTKTRWGWIETTNIL
jgi:hypothetical protein